MAKLEELKELLHSREQLNEEFKALTKTALHSEEETVPARGDAPFFDFYKDKINHFKEDNEHLFVSAEVKRRKIAEGEARLDRILAALMQKQQQFAKASDQHHWLSHEVEALEVKIRDLVSNTDNLRQVLSCAHDQDSPLKGLIEHNISQLVHKRSSVALLESQKALQDSQFGQTNERSRRLVDSLARAQNDAGDVLRQFQLPPAEKASLECLRERAREQQMLRAEKERLAVHFARLIRDKASFLERYKENRGIVSDLSLPQNFIEIIHSEDANAVVSL